MQQYEAAAGIYTILVKNSDRDYDSRLKRALCRCLTGQSASVYVEDVKRYMIHDIVP